MGLDIFIIKSDKSHQNTIDKIQNRFPNSRVVNELGSNLATIFSCAKKSFTKNFYVIDPMTEVIDDFNFTSKPEKWDEHYVHIWVKENQYSNSKSFSGIRLYNKKCVLGRKKLETKYIEVVASKYPPMSIFTLNKDVNSLEEAIDKSEHMWLYLIDDDINLRPDFRFHPTDINFNNNEIYYFRNEYGFYTEKVKLLSKNYTKEAGVKYVDEIAIDVPKYDIFYLKNNSLYTSNDKKTQNQIEINDEDQETAFELAASIAATDYFWMVNSEVQPVDSFDFRYLIDLNKLDNIHIWQKANPITNLPYCYDGIKLIPKNMILNETISHQDHVDNRYSKITQVRKVACKDHKFDVIFLSYDEANADKNFEKLKVIAPHAKRVHGVKGIFNAHKQAAEIADTGMFYVVDADAELDPSFDFSFYPNKWEQNIVYVWRCLNPINNLVYGYGGVKLFPTIPLRNATKWKVDFTTSIGVNFRAMPSISNITAFNVDPFSTWKSAFRECVKLSSKIIDRQKDDETEERLDIWCSVGADRPFGEYCISGARMGREYGSRYKGNAEALSRINDFEWLREQFETAHDAIKSP